MALSIVEVGAGGLREYSAVSIAFEARSIFRVKPREGGLGGISLIEDAVDRPYIKDYDAYEEGGPERWKTKFDLRKWGIFIGYESRSPVCGATVAFDTPGVHMLAGRRDLAVLWDIRVAPEMRRSGTGTRIFGHSLEWARSRGARQIKIETQNTNVTACRFYRSMGCRLGEINTQAYADDPLVSHEVMLVWYLDL